MLNRTVTTALVQTLYLTPMQMLIPTQMLSHITSLTLDIALILNLALVLALVATLATSANVCVENVPDPIKQQEEVKPQRRNAVRLRNSTAMTDTVIDLRAGGQKEDEEDEHTLRRRY